MIPATRSQKSGPTAGEKSGPTAGEKRAQPTAGKNSHFIVRDVGGQDDRTADDEPDEKLHITWKKEQFQT